MYARPRIRSVAVFITVFAAISTVVAAPPSSADVAAAGKTIRFEYDCSVVPWPCSGARQVRRWQMWTVACPASGCVWKWLERAETGTAVDVVSAGTYRLFFGYDNDYDNIATFYRVSDPSQGEIYLDLVYQCTRFPYVCDGDKGAWQLYSCEQQRDGTCAWTWEHELTGNTSGVYEVLPLDDYLLYWGLPRGRAETPTPAPTETATRTATATRLPSVTPTARATETVGPAPSATRPTAHPTTLPTALPTEAPAFRAVLPWGLRP